MTEFKSGPFKGQSILRLVAIAAAAIVLLSAASYYSGLYGAFQ